MDIRILPSNIANMIAAGEVVQRPSSVVKELMENAVDADATKIRLIVRDAGRTSIQVIDDGCGMTADQAVLCFERHATSKIHSAEDLEAIETFGFRGEALASISAVAEVTLRTRTADEESGTQVTITDATANDPGRQDVTEVATPVGCNFIVRNIFYNTPARRKFLKSDAVEMKSIIAEFIKIALTRTDISFTLVSNDREIYRLGAAKTVKFRIKDIFGENAADELYPMDAQTSVAGISGFVARPDKARKNVSNQFFFVNGRYFRSPYLHKAVMKAYENLIPEGVSPSYFIYLEVDPHAVDINVHPTKTEIKFEDDNVLFTVLMAAVKEALGRSSYADTLDFDAGGLPELGRIGASFAEYKPVASPVPEDNPRFNPFENDGFDNQKEWEGGTPSSGSFSGVRQGGGPWAGAHSGYEGDNGSGGSLGLSAGTDDLSDADSGSYPVYRSHAATDYTALLDQALDARRPRASLLVKGRYILSSCPSGFLLVHAGRAMERIMYERFIDAMSKEEPAGQTTMFPIEIEVGAMNMPVLEQYLPMMQRLGFDYAPFSANTINVTAVPSGLVDDRMSLSALMYEAVTALVEERASIAASLYGPLAQKMAKSASRSAVLPFDESSARTLIDSLYACSSPEITADGQKTVQILHMEDLDKFFK